MEFYKKISYSTSTDTIMAVKDSIDNYKLLYVTDLPDQIDAQEFYAKLSDECGHVFPLNEGKTKGVLTGERWLININDPSEPDRFRSSNTRQPLHTDSYCLDFLKDNISFFFCMGNALLGGATFFLDLDTLIEAMELDNEHALIGELMQRSITFAKNTFMRSRPILAKDEFGYSVNYNYPALSPDNTPEGKLLVEKFQNYLETRIRDSGIYFSIKLKRNDAVFFHDQRILHGRYAFQTPNKGDRVLCKGVFLLPSRAHIKNI